MFSNSFFYFSSLPVACLIFHRLRAEYKPVFLLVWSMVLIGLLSWQALVLAVFLQCLNWWGTGKMYHWKNEKFSGDSVGRGTTVTVVLIGIQALFFLYLHAAHAERWFPFLSINNLDWWHPNWTIALGLSFYTLQQIAYTVDVHLKRIVPESSLSHYLLHHLLFFRFVMGPIDSYQKSKERLLHSFSSSPKMADFVVGIQRITVGLFKKWVLSERLVPIVQEVFAGQADPTTLYSWLGAFCFFMQLYFDFSGYMDMAAGSARFFGIHLPENFSLPFRSLSVTSFWRKWHITLMNWLTQYVYYPVLFQWRKNPNMGVPLAIGVTFLVSGIWHGFGLHFILYALIHGAMVVLEYKTKDFRKKLSTRMPAFLFQSMAWFLTMWVITLSLVFFHSPSLEQAWGMVMRLFDGSNLFHYELSWKTWLLNGGRHIEDTFNIRFILGLSILYLLVEPKIEKWKMNEQPQIAMMFFLLLSLILFRVYGTVQQFYYLQF